MLPSLRKIFRSISYLINHFDDIPNDLLGDTNNILSQQLAPVLSDLRLLQLIDKNELFQEHVRRLADVGETAFPEVSYPLERTARKLVLYIDRERTRRDTVVCSVALGDDYRRSLRPCLESHRRYAERAGADHVQLEQHSGHTDRPPAWQKIPLLYRLLHEGYERVLFLDADAMVTNLDVSLDRLFAPLSAARQVMLIAEDEGGINTGVILATRHPAAYRLLDLVWTYHLRKPLGNWEQDALSELMLLYRSVRDVVLVTREAKAFNSFPYEREHIFNVIQQNNWTPGDFVCHFSGIRPPGLEQLIDSYVKEHGLGPMSPDSTDTPSPASP